ncbi:hypothetical protein Thiowin_03906 [Thiorhodovibrio winogradskyi]|uniref:DUF3558 domain-containing protein n=2 Tax=Thiorhodovibrio winogradskyi TaxID=77007 RepID=A0ABZ0SCR7_9GAMM
MTSVLTIVLGVLPCLLAACTSALAAETHACDVLGKARVAEVTGLQVEEVETQAPNPLGQSICFFSLPDQGLKPRFVQLQLTDSENPALKSKQMTAEGLYSNNMSFLEGARAVAGIGDKALWGGSGLTLGAGLHVLHGDLYFSIMVASGNPQTSLEQASILAKTVIKNFDSRH